MAFYSSLARLFLSAALFSLLTGCGQTGSLYLPNPSPSTIEKTA